MQIEILKGNKNPLYNLEILEIFVKKNREISNFSKSQKFRILQSIEVLENLEIPGNGPTLVVKVSYAAFVSNDRSTPNNVPIRSEFSRILSKCEEVQRIRDYITNCQIVVQQQHSKKIYANCTFLQSVLVLNSKVSTVHSNDL